MQVDAPSGAVDWVAPHIVGVWRRRRAGGVTEWSATEDDQDETKHDAHMPRRTPEQQWSMAPTCDRCGTAFGQLVAEQAAPLPQVRSFGL